MATLVNVSWHNSPSPPLDLDIEISARDGKYFGWAENSLLGRRGRGNEAIESDVDELIAPINDCNCIDAENALNRICNTAQLGAELFDKLFGPDAEIIRNWFKAGNISRIKFYDDPGRPFPIEFLYTAKELPLTPADISGFLGYGRHIERHPRWKFSFDRENLGEPIVTAVVAEPYDGHVGSLRDTFNGHKFKHVIGDFATGASRGSSLQQHVLLEWKTRADILHLFAHLSRGSNGKHTVTLLTDQNPVGIDLFCKDLTGKPLVLLNICNENSTGSLLPHFLTKVHVREDSAYAHNPWCVIAPLTRIDEMVAARFQERFYMSLCEGNNAEYAFNVARHQLIKENPENFIVLGYSFFGWPNYTLPLPRPKAAATLDSIGA
jgi:hypothetical protein